MSCSLGFVSCGWTKWDPDKTPILGLMPFITHVSEHEHCIQFPGEGGLHDHPMWGDIFQSIYMTFMSFFAVIRKTSALCSHCTTFRLPEVGGSLTNRCSQERGIFL